MEEKHALQYPAINKMDKNILDFYIISKRSVYQYSVYQYSKLIASNNGRHVCSFCKREARKSQKWVENGHKWGMAVRG